MPNECILPIECAPPTFSQIIHHSALCQASVSTCYNHDILPCLLAFLADSTSCTPSGTAVHLDSGNQFVTGYLKKVENCFFPPVMSIELLPACPTDSLSLEFLDYSTFIGWWPLPSFASNGKHDVFIQWTDELMSVTDVGGRHPMTAILLHLSSTQAKSSVLFSYFALSWWSKVWI